MDLDGFKQVNDSFGHDVGDLLLREVAALLRNCTRETDKVARLAGDEFTLILSQTGQEKAIEVSQRIIDELQKPFYIEHHQVRVTTSIGIAVFPEHGKDLKTLMKNADEAMYVSKTCGKNKYQIYSTPLLIHRCIHMFVDGEPLSCITSEKGSDPISE